MDRAARVGQQFGAAFPGIVQYTTDILFREEVKAKDWTEQVYKPDILAKRDTIYKEPEYAP